MHLISVCFSTVYLIVDNDKKIRRDNVCEIKMCQGNANKRRRKCSNRSEFIQESAKIPRMSSYSRFFSLYVIFNIRQNAGLAVR